MVKIKFGSSGIPVQIGNTAVTKTGPVDKIQPGYQAYLRLFSLLADQSWVLPTIIDFSIDSNQATLVIERFPRELDLEEFILETQDEEERISFIEQILKSVIQTLDNWQKISVNENPEILLQEITQALDFTWKNAGDTSLFDFLTLKQLLDQKSIRSYLLTGIKIGPCHKDLCTNNIWPMPDDSVRFFDPHWSLTGSKISSTGNVVLDLVSLRVNLERLQFDRDKLGLKLPLPLNLIDDYIGKSVNEGKFTEELYLLVLLRRYLSFAACRCDHCLNPKRIHRFELMREKAKEVKRVMIKKLEKIGG